MCCVPQQQPHLHRTVSPIRTPENPCSAPIQKLVDWTLSHCMCFLVFRQKLLIHLSGLHIGSLVNFHYNWVKELRGSVLPVWLILALTSLSPSPFLFSLLCLFLCSIFPLNAEMLTTYPKNLEDFFLVDSIFIEDTQIPGLWKEEIYYFGLSHTQRSWTVAFLWPSSKTHCIHLHRYSLEKEQIQLNCNQLEA